MKQRSLRPPSYPERADIGANPHDWYDEAYAPVTFSLPCFSNPSERPVWAEDVYVPFLDMLSRPNIDRKGEMTTLSNSVMYDFKAGRFLNPLGKTGIVGRGVLGKWGPNWAADVLITKEEDGVLFALLAEKKVGDGQSALCWPAGMVEAGESVPDTLRRELCEEALEDSAVVDALFEECKVQCVYAGVVDDYRNTDHAWMVTQAHHYHATPQIAAQLQLGVKDKQEIRRSAWFKAVEVKEMYASHRDWLDALVAWYDRLKRQRTALAALDEQPAAAQSAAAQPAESAAGDSTQSAVTLAAVDDDKECVVGEKRPREDTA